MRLFQKQNFLQGAVVLMLATIIVKIVGAVFKMPLGNILEESGMAYFSAAFNLFMTIYALTVTGLSTAVARMVASCSTKGRFRDCRSILKTAQKVFLILGGAGTVIMLLGAKFFAHAAGLDGAFMAIIVMSPAIFFSCMMATYRGYYEGLSNMIPSALSEIVEVLTKLVLGLGVTFLVLRIGENGYAQNKTVFGTVISDPSQVAVVLRPYAAAGAMIGVTLSTAFGFLYMYLSYKKRGDNISKEDIANSPNPIRNKFIFERLAKTALPITLSAVVINLTGMIDLFSVMNRLNHAIAVDYAYFNAVYGAFLNGKTVDMAEYIYGGYTMAMPIFNLVPAFTVLFGKSALPNVTKAWVSKDLTALKKNITLVVYMTSLIAFPAGVGMTVLAQRFATMLYPNIVGAAITVGLPLRALGISAIFLSMIAPLYAILQALGHFDLPVKFMLVGGTIKIITNFFLVGIPQINISGAAIGTAACYMIILFLCLNSLKTVTGIKFQFAKILIKNATAALFCGAAAIFICTMGDSNSITILAVCGGGLVYAAVSAILNVKSFSQSLKV